MSCNILHLVVEQMTVEQADGIQMVVESLSVRRLTELQNCWKIDEARFDNPPFNFLLPPLSLTTDKRK